MRERPILFSAPMVRALLEGRKHQTRRICKRQPKGTPREYLPDCWDFGGSAAEGPALCPFGIPGDQLWVRETWAHDYLANKSQSGCWYRADTCRRDPPGVRCEHGPARWRRSIHMPRWASRLTLEITDVRVERLQDISEEDAKAEGVTPFPKDPEGDCWTDGTHRTAFNHLWNAINGWEPNAWDINPWVWVLGLKRIEQKARAA